MKQGVVQKYKYFFSDISDESIISLGEGDTPLILVPKIAEKIGFIGQLYFKYEGANPTGSFKDRGMTTAVSKSMQEGAKMFACASTGNTAASATAYGAVAGVPVFVLVPSGGIAEGKHAQIVAYGGRIIEVSGNFDDCQRIIREIDERYSEVVVLNNTHPYRLPGQRTVAFEIWEELLRAPDYHFIPVGNAGNITANWWGYKCYCDYLEEELKIKENSTKGIISDMELRVLSGRGVFEEIKKIRNSLAFGMPKMMGYQAEGSAPIVRGRAIENPQTIASAIRIGNPIRWREAEEAVLESEGRFGMVTDEEIVRSHDMIAKLCPQVACEPSSATSLAGLIKSIWRGEIENNEDTVVVCTLTGAWWKDQDIFRASNLSGSKAIEPDFAKVARELEL